MIPNYLCMLNNLYCIYFGSYSLYCVFFLKTKYNKDFV